MLACVLGISGGFSLASLGVGVGIGRWQAKSKWKFIIHICRYIAKLKMNSKRVEGSSCARKPSLSLHSSPFLGSGVFVDEISRPIAYNNSKQAYWQLQRHNWRLWFWLSPIWGASTRETKQVTKIGWGLYWMLSAIWVWICKYKSENKHERVLITK